MSASPIEQDSAFARRRRLYGFVRKGYIGPEVLNELLPKGEAHQYEDRLWDYKLELPSLPIERKPNEAEKEQYSFKMANIVKDAVSFYNSYGGYLVIGVRNQPRNVEGFDRVFDCDELNKKIKAATKHDVNCHFVLHDIQTETGKKRTGLLFIPQRQENKEPAQFLRNAPSTDHTKLAYKKGEFYFRDGHECRTAETSEDISFLCSWARRQIVAPNEVGSFPVSNNLGPRDPGFISFIGREEYLQELWLWLCDRFSPAKLLAGLGGVGKTTLAREFCEELIRNSALGFERVIWLSAKQQFYTAILAEYRPTGRVDFTDVESLIRHILLELSYTEEMIDLEWTRTELIDELITALSLIPSFIVIDDVDSLSPDQQNEVFQTILQIMNRTVGPASVPSRALLTARLKLGAAPGQLKTVKGLELDEFCAYVEMTAKSIELPWNIKANSKAMKKFHDVTMGSPTFAASILRLVQRGEGLESALNKWGGSHGEEVRKFAFQKELNNLTQSQLRTLYAACILGDTSFVELEQITQSNTTLFQDDLDELRKYHLLALDDDVVRGGPRLVVPSSIRLMSDLIKSRLSDPKRIERECAKARIKTPRIETDVRNIIQRARALWQVNKPEEALEIISIADQKNRDTPDLKYLLGKAYLLITPSDAKKSDVAFKKAYELGSRRLEMVGLWADAKKLRGDWIGIIEITRLADKQEPSSDNIFLRAEAHGQLGEIAVKAGNPRSALGHYRSGIEEINRAFAIDRTRGRSLELSDLRQLLFQNYVKVTDGLTTEPNEHIEVWFASMYAFSSLVRQSDLIRLGIERLDTWWKAVEQREKTDLSSANLMKEQLEKLDGVIAVLKRHRVPNVNLTETAQRKRNSLYKRWQSYAALAQE